MAVKMERVACFTAEFEKCEQNVQIQYKLCYGYKKIFCCDIS